MSLLRVEHDGVTTPCPVAALAGIAPDREAVRVGPRGLSTSYGSLHGRAATMAGALQKRGLSGKRVAVAAASSVDLVALHIAAARSGVTLVPLHLRLLPDAQRSLAARAEVALSLDDAALAELARHPDGGGEGNVDGDTDVIAFDHETVLFTSGTTGPSKGARVPFRALVASADAACSVVDAAEDDVWLMCMPLFHIGGIAMMWRSLLTGACLHLLPVVDVDVIADFCTRGVIQHASVVPTTLLALLPKLTTVSPRVKALLIGGGPVSEAALVRARAAGLPVVWTWGMTETASQAATGRPGEPPRAAALPLPGVFLRVVDATHGDVAADGVTVGDLLMRGPTLFRGYLGEGGAVVDDDGFFRTGDLATKDAEGRIAIVSRRGDLIISGGENIYPWQIEDALAACPGVVDIAVAAVDHPVWGQRPVAFVVGNVKLVDVAAFATSTLSRLQHPDRFVIVDALPRNAMGKLDRTTLRQWTEGLG